VSAPYQVAVLTDGLTIGWAQPLPLSRCSQSPTRLLCCVSSLALCFVL
jgi:hypothetical protein